MIALGIAIAIASFFTSFILLIYALIIFVLGIVIFFNKKEDKIEQIIERRKK